MMRALPLAAAAALWLPAASIAGAGKHVDDAPARGLAAHAPEDRGEEPVAAPQRGGRAAATAGSATPTKDGVEPVTIATRDNVSLTGDFYAPRKKGRAPAALLVHDLGGERSQLAPVADKLQKLGFAVLTIDLRGHGQSRAEQLDWTKLDEQGRERMWALTPRDLSAASEYLRSRTDVHTSNLSVIGLRAGSAVAVHYAADDQNARAVVILDPQSEGHGFNLAKDVEKLQGLPTLILAPSGQRTIADRLAQCGRDANGGSEFISKSFLKGDSDTLLDDKSMPREVGDWLKQQVMPGKDER